MKNLLTLIFIWAHFLYTHSQNNYFVATNGNNNNNGSVREPWKSVQYGLDHLKPGDILYIKGGTYAEKMQLNVSGTKTNPITIKAYNNETVILDANSIANSNSMFRAYNKSFFTVEGIHFTNSFHKQGGGGFIIDGYGENITLINCKFSNIAISRDPNTTPTYNTNQPVVLFMGTNSTQPIKNIRVSGVEIFNCRPGYSECLTISGNAEYFEFSNNYIHHNANIGIDAAGHYGYCKNPDLDYARHGIIKNNLCHHNQSPVAASAGIYIDGASHIIIENNTLHNNFYGAEIGCEESGTATNIIFRNNSIYNNRMAGIALGGYNETTGGRVTHSKILNNTFYNNDTDNTNQGELFISQLENSQISSNIFYLSKQNHLMSNYRNQPDLTITFNLIFSPNNNSNITSNWNNQTVTGLPNIQAYTNTGSSNFYSNPEFKNIEELNFSLTSNSAAIDKGDPNYTPHINETDLNNEQRLHNNRIDCGADEFNPNLNTQNQNKPIVSIHPNPVLNKTTITTNFKNYNASILTINGKHLKDYKNIPETFTFNLSHLKPAIYFIKIHSNTNKNVGTYKIVKH